MPDKRLIDANALLKRIAHHTVHDSLKHITFEAANTYEQVKGDMFNLVQKAQTIDAVEVVHGRWEKVQVWKDNQQTTLRCSLCKKKSADIRARRVEILPVLRSADGRRCER